MKTTIEIIDEMYPQFRNQPRISLWAMLAGVLIMIALLLGCMRIAWAEPVALTASWYSRASLIKEGTWKNGETKMANGEYFRDGALTCATRLFRLGSYVRVTCCASGKSVVVRVTDRIGKRFATKRIDLSKAAMQALGGQQALNAGIVKVMAEEVR